MVSAVAIPRDSTGTPRPFGTSIFYSGIAYQKSIQMQRNKNQASFLSMSAQQTVQFQINAYIIHRLVKKLKN